MKRLLMILHIFVGLGGMAGGFGAIMNPKAPMGAPVEMLRYSPFDDFLIPGILLFSVIGIGNVISFFILRSNVFYRLYVSNVFSWALVIWIVVQCVMLRAINILHVLFFLIGVVEVFFATSLLFQQRLFPTNLIRQVFTTIKEK